MLKKKLGHVGLPSPPKKRNGGLGHLFSAVVSAQKALCLRLQHISSHIYCDVVLANVAAIPPLAPQGTASLRDPQPCPSAGMSRRTIHKVMLRVPELFWMVTTIIVNLWPSAGTSTDCHFPPFGSGLCREEGGQVTTLRPLGHCKCSPFLCGLTRSLWFGSKPVLWTFSPCPMPVPCEQDAPHLL